MAKKLKPADHYDDLKQASGWYLAAWRDVKGLSQQALADAMETSKGQVSDLENGAINKKGQQTRYNRDWLEKACAALEVAAGDLLDTNPAREEPKYAALRRAFPGLSEKDAETVSRLADDLRARA
ncbi:helix-turn-helix domain-containing protein [Brevundimonas sp. GCM10030266]|uniref:helix-turn-helix domain-containing protein n=1 Tax=Brevundimonas sp. GCM10030266 TaxID=3273386 RepID=UPI00360FB522